MESRVRGPRQISLAALGLMTKLRLTKPKYSLGQDRPGCLYSELHFLYTSLDSHRKADTRILLYKLDPTVIVVPTEGPLLSSTTVTIEITVLQIQDGKPPLEQVFFAHLRQPILSPF